MKSPREILLKACIGYCMDESIGEEDGILDQALSDLAEIVMGIKKDEDKGSGAGCTCGAYGECECGCENADWNNYRLYNQAITDIAKLFEEQTKKGER